MKKFLLFIFLIITFFFSIYFFYRSYGFIFFVKDHQIIKLALKENFFAKEQKELLVEVVNRQESTEKGLSLRNDLEDKTGQKVDALLFIFPEKEIRRFWMKDMLFDIDICWLNNLAFSSCERKVPFSLSNQNLKIYSSPLVTNLVLETKVNKLNDEELKLKLFFKW